ncbi:MAG: alkaline phosphatase family protein [Xanthomonadaceae bacterium]|nr:alkaline phosphatase family protein [Xanthomonadaceae bacterium]
MACALPMPRAIAGDMPNAVMPPVRHVFVIVLENESYQVTFGKGSLAPYLASTLPGQGALLTRYYGIGHNSLDNYIAMISGQAPNPATQGDCKRYVEFVATGAPDALGQLPGSGCVYPATVKTLADQLQQAGLSWKGYMEDMGASPRREADACGHVAIGTIDATRMATATDEYADKHDPFVYFHSIIDDHAGCARHVVNLTALAHDIKRVDTTPNLAYIVPGLCHDGHDAPCADGEPGGLVSADRFLRTWVPRIVQSPAFRRDGLLVITFDEGGDGSACCGETGLPGGPQPGKFGPGGGTVGAVLLSPFIAPGTVSHVPYNHYSLLRSIEDLFDLGHLGMAKAPGLRDFGADVFTGSTGAAAPAGAARIRARQPG